MAMGADLTDYITQIFNNLGIKIDMLISEIIVSVLILLAFIIIGWVVYHVFEHFLTSWAQRTKTRLDDEILANTKRPIYFLVLLVGTFYALEFLTILNPYQEFLSIIFTLAEIFLIAYIITRVVNVFIAWYAEKRAKRKREVSQHILFLFRKLINAMIYIIAFIVILSVFNIDLSGIIVGMGVAGIAIGLALQNVLSDIFSAFTIYFDKPYEIGDFIVIGNDMGIVKKIGIQSTRIQTLQGEELVVSNNEMVSTRIQNFKKMRKRRITFQFGVIYSTPQEKLRKIPDIIRTIINSESTQLPHIDRLDRVHFRNFGDFSLNFEVVYYLKTGDYNKYMDMQQEINLRIKEAFEKEGIELAFPTQTIYLPKTS